MNQQTNPMLARIGFLLLVSGCQLDPGTLGPGTVPSPVPVAVSGTPLINEATVQIEPAYLTIAIGENKLLVPAVKLPDGQINQNVVWHSSDYTIADVNKTTGQVSAIKEGWVTIVATYPFDPSIKGIVTVHVVKELKTEATSKFGVKLNYRSYWKLAVVDSDRKDVKTIFQLTKFGPNGTTGSAEIYVASSAYYESFVVAAKKLPLENPTAKAEFGNIVAGNKDGFGMTLIFSENGRQFKAQTMVINANGYTYIVKASGIISGDGSLETGDELQAILDSLIFEKPVSPIDLDSPKEVTTAEALNVQKGLGGLVANAPEAASIPVVPPAQPDTMAAGLPVSGTSIAPVVSPAVALPSPTSFPLPASSPSPSSVKTPAPSPTPVPFNVSVPSPTPQFLDYEPNISVSTFTVTGNWTPTIYDGYGGQKSFAASAYAIQGFSIGTVAGNADSFLLQNSTSNLVAIKKNGDALVLSGSLCARDGCVVNGGDLAHSDFFGGAKLFSDGAGNLFTLEGSRMRKNAVYWVGGGTGLNGVGTATSFNNPTDVVQDASGNFYIADTGNNLIRRVTPSAVVSTVAELPSPVGVAVDALGNLYASSARGVIVRIRPDGSAVVMAGDGTLDFKDGAANTARFKGPTKLAVGRDGSIYVLDQTCVRRIADNRVTTVAGSIAPGDAEGSGQTALFRNLNSIAFDSTGRLYVLGNGRIRRIAGTL